VDSPDPWQRPFSPHPSHDFDLDAIVATSTGFRFSGIADIGDPIVVDSAFPTSGFKIVASSGIQGGPYERNMVYFFRNSVVYCFVMRSEIDSFII
jgi:hypothetical protein